MDRQPHNEAINGNFIREAVSENQQDFHIQRMFDCDPEVPL